MTFAAAPFVNFYEFLPDVAPESPNHLIMNSVPGMKQHSLWRALIAAVYHHLFICDMM